MVRKTTTRVVEGARGGAGSVEFHDILSADEMNGHGRLYAKVVVRPHSSIGFHVHENDTEPYYILEGHGIFVDNDKSRTEVGPGDVCIIEVGQGHSLENNSDEDLVIMALVYNK
ncbi:MAG: cupin domain-containing protein [Lachnospiraceae bacterium]|nr:cupin domain-containing protein [Lachnospiraceae bacterium]